MNLYAVKDMKGDFNSSIISVQNDDMAKRTVPYIAESSELYKRYPEDFVLYRIGTFDFTSGIISPENLPVYICDLTYGGINEN